MSGLAILCIVSFFVMLPTLLILFKITFKQITVGHLVGILVMSVLPFASWILAGMMIYELLEEKGFWDKKVL
jgi:hypothetical protein